MSGASVETIALTYGVGVALAPLAQLRRIHRRRSAADVSLTWLTLYAGGCFVWLLYGIEMGSPALIVSQIVAFAATAATIAFAWGHRHGPPVISGDKQPARRSAAHRRTGQLATYVRRDDDRRE